MRLQLLIFLLLFFIYGCHSNKTDYDVIIVGGGLAGLSAAKQLQDNYKVLIIERDSILGGRVRTENYLGKYYYDLGASFALHPTFRNQIRIDDGEIIQTKDSIALFINNTLYKGMTPLEVIQKYETVNKMVKKVNFYNRNLYKIDIDTIDKVYHNIFNNLIKSVFPGSLNDYNKNILKFIFERYHSSYYLKGNYNVVDYFTKNKRFDVKLNSTVIDVYQSGNKINIKYVDTNHKQKNITGKECIVTTPAHISKSIIQNINRECLEFLDNIKYAGYYSIAIGVQQDNVNPDLAYVIPINKGFSSILKHKTTDKNFNIFHLYVANEDFSSFKDTSEVRTKSIEIIKKIWHIHDKSIKFYNFIYWPNAGVLFNETYNKVWSDKCLNPDNGIYLAGDYTNIESGIPPYGMISAILSGKRAANKIK